MKKILTLVLIITSFRVFGQNIIQGEVSYNFVYVNNLKDRQAPTTIPMRLQFSTELSFYKNDYERNFEAQVKEQMKAINFKGNIVITGESNTELDASLFNNLPKKKLIKFRNFSNQSYKIEEQYPSIEWKIDEIESRTIGTYKCRRATGHHRGRIYTAWFTDEVAVPFGPWKLFGLPGLILEAEDDKGEVKFIFKSLQTNVSNNRSIEIPRQAINTTQSKFDKMVNAIQNSEGPIVANESASSTYLNFDIKSLNVDKSKIKSISIEPSGNNLIIINNSIELKK
jgi:GLPGLI family protein